MGIFAGILAVTFLIVMHELGHFLCAKLFGVRVDVFSVGFGPKIVSKKIGETEYALSLLPLGGYVKMAGENNEETVEPGRGFEHKPVWQRLIIVLAGPVMNLVLAAAILFISFSVYGAPHTPPQIGEVLAGSPADVAGLKKGDVVYMVGLAETDGTLQTVDSWRELVMFIGGANGKKIVLYTTAGGPNRPFVVTPRPTIGIMPGPAIYEKDLLKAPGAAIRETSELTVLIVKGFWHIVTGKLGSDAIGGPIQIVQVASTAWSGAGLAGVLFFAAIMSINLGVLNLLPIPALDGGHIPFLLIEGARGKPISIVWRTRILMTGVVFLLLLTAFAFFNDFSRIFGK
ncbi:MAG: hypothetical protein A3B29_01635 [Candidatus Sungbacteria bacterium RIFCSPLOWO2_01_FULL_51_34]|nr:MAG: hypothetical protein A3B29_01635 [Candidatus Sungbacteria bacterium RIFCSPLOWO2_01_FULL_51_34]